MERRTVCPSGLLAVDRGCCPSVEETCFLSVRVKNKTGGPVSEIEAGFEH